MTASYAIHIDPGYYQGTFNVAKPGLVREHDSLYAIALATEAEAELLASMLNDTGDGPYMLNHGQYAAPDYTVREVTLPVRHTLRQAMAHCFLLDDFNLDGTRIDVSRLMYGSKP